MIIIKKKINELNPAAYNPRKDLNPEDKEYQNIKRSIETFGYIDPIIFNKRKRILRHFPIELAFVPHSSATFPQSNSCHRLRYLRCKGDGLRYFV